MKHYRQPDVDRRHFLWTAAAAGAFALSGAQRLAAQDALPTEILVNTTTVGIQDQATVAALFASRQFIVTWVNRPDATVRAQRFREDGLKVGGEFVVNSSMEPNTERLRPIISNKPGGGFLVAWIERAFNPPTPRPHVHMRRYNADGAPIGPQMQINTTEIDPAYRPSIAPMIDGGFLLTWADARPSQRIRAQRFNFDGAKTGPELGVNGVEGFHEAPLAIRLVDGNYVIAWRDDPSPPGGGALIFRIFDLEGTPQTSEIRPNISGFTGQKAMTLLDDGRFVILHVRVGVQSDLGVLQSIIEANIYEPSGAVSNLQFTATSERGISCSSPAVAPLPGGRFLASWIQKSAETFSTSPTVRARVLSASQGRLGEEVQANSAVAPNRFNAAATTISSPGESEVAFVTWDDDSRSGGDASDTAVHGRSLSITSAGL